MLNCDAGCVAAVCMRRRGPGPQGAPRDLLSGCRACVSGPRAARCPMSWGASFLRLKSRARPRTARGSALRVRPGAAARRRPALEPAARRGPLASPTRSRGCPPRRGSRHRRTSADRWHVQVSPPSSDSILGPLAALVSRGRNTRGEYRRSVSPSSAVHPRGIRRPCSHTPRRRRWGTRVSSYAAPGSSCVPKYISSGVRYSRL